MVTAKPIKIPESQGHYLYQNWRVDYFAPEEVVIQSVWKQKKKSPLFSSISEEDKAFSLEFLVVASRNELANIVTASQQLWKIKYSFPPVEPLLFMTAEWAKTSELLQCFEKISKHMVEMEQSESPSALKHVTWMHP